MNSTYRLSAEFLASMGMIPPWLQEDTLDELENLLASRKKLVMRLENDFAVHDFVRTIGGKTHYVFWGFRADFATDIITLVSLGHVERPRR